MGIAQAIKTSKKFFAKASISPSGDFAGMGMADEVRS